MSGDFQRVSPSPRFTLQTGSLRISSIDQDVVIAPCCLIMDKNICKFVIIITFIFLRSTYIFLADKKNSAILNLDDRFAGGFDRPGPEKME